MKLIVGLGNPGPKYAGNRHNVGFQVADAIRDRNGFPPWRAKFQGAFSDGRIGDRRAALLQPETFMNRSGQSVGEAARFFKIEPGDVIVIHDEIDLDPGRLKAKIGGGSGGHNGVKSIEQHIGPGFCRVRVGVGHPGRKDLVMAHVLKDFSTADREWVPGAIDRVSDGIGHLLEDDLQGFQNWIAHFRFERPDPAGAPGGEPADAGPERRRTANEEARGGGPFAKLASWFKR